jgi:hypothetical protein
MFYWIISSPFISFFIMLVWAATLGDTVAYFYENKNMFDEYLIINQVYIILILLIRLKSKIVGSSTKNQ